MADEHRGPRGLGLDHELDASRGAPAFSHPLPRERHARRWDDLLDPSLLDDLAPLELGGETELPSRGGVEALDVGHPLFDPGPGGDEGPEVGRRAGYGGAQDDR